MYTTRHKTAVYDLDIYGLEIDILQSVETLNPYLQKLRALKKKARTYTIYLSTEYCIKTEHQPYAFTPVYVRFDFVVGHFVRRGHGDKVSAEENGEPGPCTVRPE